eukprot:scaffold17017_cov93-Cyclotella_meneghiniana.AAC.1
MRNEDRRSIATMNKAIILLTSAITTPTATTALLSPQQGRRGHPSTSLSAKLRDFVGYPDNDDRFLPPPGPRPSFDFNPFVEDDFGPRNYVTRDDNRRRRVDRYDIDRRDSRPGRRQQRDDVPPSNRSAGQLARMYTNNLEPGRPNFNSLTVVERYFEAWNRRNVPLALACFDDSVYYDDTQFNKAFEGKDALAKHLIYVVDCVPESWGFVVDGLSVGPVERRRGSVDDVRRDSRQGGGQRQRPGSNARGLSIDGYRDGLYDNRSLPNLVNIAALWHVENDNGPLPYSRGCSFFMVNPSTNLIVEAYDFPEPAVVKPGATGLKILSIASKLMDEPVRFIPFVVWTTYVWVVFFTNGILPGKDIFHADPRAWNEIRALSLNVFYFSPILGMKLSPSVHPCLEAIFNTLIAWVFMFFGFLSDERTGAGSEIRDFEPYYEKLYRRQDEILEDGRLLVPPVAPTKRNLIAIFPTIIGMQFLTSAFLLPYLFCRTSERTTVSSFVERRPRNILTRPLYKEELDKAAAVVGESRALGVIGGFLGLLGVYWFFNGRIAEFGPPLWESPKRMESFMKLLKIDRVGSTFIVDLIIFSFFQGWLVEDDWRRRGRSMDDEQFLRNVAKFVPFWGLACYLTFRPGCPSRNELDVDEIDARGFRNSRGNSFFGGFERGFNDLGRSFNRGRNDGYYDDPRRRDNFIDRNRRR